MNIKIGDRVMDNAIVVAMSGGVDSAVAAYLLKEKQGWENVVGATHYIWPDSKCCSVDVLTRAKRLCETLKIPYFVIDLHKEFKKFVVENFIETYLAGKTPNPCVMCNQRIRFDLFYKSIRNLLIEKNLLNESSFLYMATGHYVRIEKINGRFFLKRARDVSKDQSYMLYRVPQSILPYLVFPLGDCLKSEVYEISRELGINFSSINESQDACFVKGDYVDFIKEQRGIDGPGEGIIKSEDGEILGKHKGYLNYTIGQRRGLGLGNGPWYVKSVDSRSNTVIVAKREDANSESFYVIDTNWFVEPPDKKPIECLVKIRYQSKAIPCLVSTYVNGSYRVQMERGEFVTPGQSAVFYREDLVLGGGIIDSVC